MLSVIATHHQRAQDDKCLNSIRSQEPLQVLSRCWCQKCKSKHARLREFKALGRQAPVAEAAALLKSNDEWEIGYSAPLRSSRSLSSSNK